MKKRIGVKKQLSSSVIAERSIKALKQQKRAVPQKPKPVKHVNLKQILVSPETRIREKGYSIFGGFKIPDIPEDDKKFWSKFTELNRYKLKKVETQQIETFNKIMPGYQKTWKNLAEFTRKYVQSKRYDSIREAIENFLAPSEVKQTLRLYNLIKKDTAFLQELSLRANEKIDVNRFSHLGDEVYVYTTSRNKKIKIRIKWSPIQLEIIG